jgi:hypothetical protein
LSLPEENLIAIKKIFGTNIEKKEDKQTIRVEKEVQSLVNVCKLAASFKDVPKISSKHYVLKDPKDKNNQKIKKSG